MRGFLAVVRREIEEKSFVFGAALVASLVPFAVPLVRGLNGQDARDMRNWLALVLAGTLGTALAVSLGSTALASELAERRIGFYFSRPVTGLSLWAGKLGAAFLISLAATGMVYTPTLVANGGRILPMDLPPGIPAVFVVALLGTVLVFHAGNILLRPRSLMLLLDLAAAILVSLGAIGIDNRLSQAFAAAALDRATVFLALLFPAAVVAAGLLAILRGRTDARRAHRALSLVLWGTLGAGVAASALYVRWVLSASPKDLDEVADVVAAPSGPWSVVEGPARGGVPVFLFDTVAGTYRRVGEDWHRPVLSPDGAHAAWFEAEGRGGPFRTVCWSLSSPTERQIKTKILLPAYPGAAFLSEGAGRIAILDSGSLSVVELPAGTSLGSARVRHGGWRTRGYFVGQNRLRLFTDAPSPRVGVAAFEIVEFDVATRTLTKTGSFESGTSFQSSPGPDRSHLLTRAQEEEHVLRDARTGQVVARLRTEGSVRGRGSLAHFARDGHIVIPTLAAGVAHLEVFSVDGRPERVIALPGVDRVVLGGEAASGKLVVSAGTGAGEISRRTIFLADLSSGEVHRVSEGLLPVTFFAGYVSDRPNDLPEPGSEATKLFYGPGRSLIHFDPLTGERRVILGGRQR